MQWHRARSGFSVKQRGESVYPITLQHPKVRPFAVVLFLLPCFPLALAQEAKPNEQAPKYDRQTETKTKGVVDEIKVLNFGPRKDFVELIVKNGEDKFPVYVCPKPFEDEMGITFNKGDEISITGSKVKQETLDVILARELVKGTDTLMFRDDKGSPVWDWRTGK
jgi:hypothetical protein